MKPIETLMNEHRLIEQVLSCLEEMTARAAAERRLDGRSARQAVDFLRRFADACHHGKEEQHLFAMMEARGFSPHEGPTAVMRAEHVQGRELIGQMERAIEGAEAGRPEALDGFAQAARDYLMLLRDHITKEDRVLFPMAEQVLEPETHDALAQKFDEVDAGEFGGEFEKKYRGVADALADRFGIERADYRDRSLSGR